MRRLPLLVAAATLALAAPAHSAWKAPCIPGTQAPKCTFWKARATFIADGDTIKAVIAGDPRRRQTLIRFNGINAMELHRYSSRPSLRRGDCHAVEAAALVERYIRRSHRRIRLSAQRASSHSGGRLRRSVWVKLRGRWTDLAALELQRGLALWLPNDVEWAQNRAYHVLSEQAALAGRGLYATASCGAGPDQDVPLAVSVNWDADGKDAGNLDGEWVEIRNGGARPVALGGWWVRDSWLNHNCLGVPGYELPAGTVLAPGGSVRVHVGCGSDRGNDLYWCQRSSAFENVTSTRTNMGDGGYLFDPQGDLRAWTLYPCLVACSDPLLGLVRLSVQARGDEKIGIRNIGTSAVDLVDHVLKLHNGRRRDSYVFGYPFGAGSVLAPGETMVVRPGGSGPNSRLVRNLHRGDHMLTDAGGTVSLRTATDIVTDCRAWGSARRRGCR
jgi:endonuclease YncB( thermonuclease family)